MKDNDAVYTINIPKWDKWQRPMRTKGRDYIMVSTNMYHDPAVMALTPTARWCWVCMLLHGGSVGVPFELSMSRGRVLFGLKHSIDFSLLANQGLIEFELHDTTLQDTTYIPSVYNRSDDQKKKPKKKATKKKKPSKRCPPDFQPDAGSVERMWIKYPHLDDSVFITELENMKDCEFKNAKVDWDAAFRTWIGNYVKWNKPQQSAEQRKVSNTVNAVQEFGNE